MSHHRVVVIGAGMSGVCAAIDLERAGISDFRVFEKAHDVGGTWRDNRYPGVACDVPSHLYSYSFEPNPDWSKWYGTGQEIWDYIGRCADKYGVREHITFDNGIVAAAWHDDHWQLTDSTGASHTADAVVAAMGGLHTPNIPPIPGLETFQGPMFHTTAWDHTLDLRGKRVAVIGTGATAVQFVPEIAPLVAELYVFQRSPVWVGPKRDPVYGEAERAAFRADPLAMKRHRWQLWKDWEATGLDMATEGTWVNRRAEQNARQLIARSVSDPALAAALTPGYNFTCKRPTLSNDYYATFERDNVHLVQGAVERISPTGLATAEVAVDVDVIILATGFKPMDITLEIDLKGLDGLTLDAAWAERISSYRSVMVRGFPNLFIMMGPNSAGLTSALQSIEQQSKYIVRVLERIRELGIVGLHPRAEGIEAFEARLVKAFRATTHNKGCTSWWSDGSGHNHSIWPESSVTYRMLLADVELQDFDLIERRGAAASVRGVGR